MDGNAKLPFAACSCCLCSVPSPLGHAFLFISLILRHYQAPEWFMVVSERTRQRLYPDVWLTPSDVILSQLLPSISSISLVFYDVLRKLLATYQIKNHSQPKSNKDISHMNPLSFKNRNHKHASKTSKITVLRKQGYPGPARDAQDPVPSQGKGELTHTI